MSRGIQATGWPEIADKAGVPVETVKTLFPTQDRLVESCAEHFMESLQLPPADGDWRPALRCPRCKRISMPRPRMCNG